MNKSCSLDVVTTITLRSQNVHLSDLMHSLAQEQITQN